MYCVLDVGGSDCNVELCYDHKKFIPVLHVVDDEFLAPIKFLNWVQDPLCLARQFVSWTRTWRDSVRVIVIVIEKKGVGLLPGRCVE